ncbi:MAG: C1 family peptidase [Candidatus Aureabacteria bacterium]|nr:C1 family peptidase [Candidatus Auribacterota bacterium]
MSRRSANSLAIIVIVSVIVFSAIPARAQKKTILKFGPNDSIETLRAKIAHNGYKFTVVHNWVYDMLPEEKADYFSSYPGTSIPENVSRDIGPLEKQLGDTLPESFDWRNYNGHSYIGPIRDQNKSACGSSYAFGACAAAEGTYNWAHGVYGTNCIDLSEAHLMWNLGQYGAYLPYFHGCAGADYDYHELDALTADGILTEDRFAYTVNDPLAYYHKDTKHPELDRTFSFDSWHRIPCGDIEAIKTAIIDYGVVVAKVYADTAFQAYSGGVYTDASTSCEGGDTCYYQDFNHAVALVGWDDADQCWILRNSWGATAWGESGYMRISYTAARVSCAVAYLVSAPKPGQLSVYLFTSSPSKSMGTVGGEIYLDYSDTGLQANATLPAVSEGVHHVYLVPPEGTPPQPPQQMKVVPDDPGWIPPTPHPPSEVVFTTGSNPGSIDVTSSPELGGEIFLDYQDTGLTSPHTLDNVSAGSHYVLVRRDDCLMPPFYEVNVPHPPTPMPTVQSSLNLPSATPSAKLQVFSNPPGADIYIDYVSLIGTTNATIDTGIEQGMHTVSVRKTDYLPPPPQVVDLTAATTTLTFTLIYNPTPTEEPTPFPTTTPVPTATPVPTFPPGLRLYLNQDSYKAGDACGISVSFTDTFVDWDGYVVIIGNGHVWSVTGSGLKAGVIPIVRNAREIHNPFYARVLTLQVPYGASGVYMIYCAILPTRMAPTLENARSAQLATAVLRLR